MNDTQTKLPWIAKSKILVVEDSAQMRRILCSMLHTLGAGEIFEAEDGDTAIEMIGEAIPDLIVLDYVMPGSDGLTVLAHIRQRHAEWARVPVIMVTSHASAALIAAARDGGVNELLAKPVSITKLAENIEAAMRAPRPFVDDTDYFGPDRRRREDQTSDPERRRSQSASAVN